MQTTTTQELTCAVFGHNLERYSSNDLNSHELICKTCQSKVLVDNNGEFDELPYKNRSINDAFKRLFLLKSQYSRQHISA